MIELGKKPFSAKMKKKSAIIDMTHGSGGLAMTQLIEEFFINEFAAKQCLHKNDKHNVFTVNSGKMVMTTDSYVISPLFFPGGNIGSLAIHGTVNDLAMAGAKPLYLSVAFILEEGFPLADLKRIVAAMADAASQVGVAIAAGDTKVVERGKGDGIFINTTGIGVVPDFFYKEKVAIQPGDKLILSGYLGDHGVAVLSQRNNLQFKTSIISDSTSLTTLVEKMITSVPGICCMQDPTRGGLAAVLNEWAWQFSTGFIIDEAAIPVREEVQSACELLGLDVLHTANEGKLVAICKEEEVDKLLAVMHAHPLGKQAAVIGEVIEDDRHFVQLRTVFGGLRIVDWLNGEQLPRIC